jgi:hypothetical protein
VIGFERGDGNVVYKQLASGDYTLALHSSDKLWDVFRK